MENDNLPYDDEFLHMMYANEDEDGDDNNDDNKVDKGVTAEQAARNMEQQLTLKPGYITSIKMFGKVTNIPSVDYVKSLERKLDQKDQQLQNLNNKVNMLKNSIRVLDKKIAELGKQLQKKIDRYD